MPLEPEDRSSIETIIKVVLALVPVVGGAAIVVWDDLRDATAGRLRLTADEVTEAVGVERLTERLADSPEFAALCVNALETAARTGFEAMRRVLARVLINAARDEAKVDEGVLVHSAIKELEGPHIRAAERMRQVEASSRMTPEYAARYPGSDMTTPASIADKRAHDVYEASRAEPEPVLATLVRTGMAGTPTLISVQHLAVSFITEFGRLVLDDLRDVMSDWPLTS